MPYIQPQAGSPYEQNLSYLLGQAPSPYLGGSASSVGGAGAAGASSPQAVAGQPSAPAGPQSSFGAGGGLFSRPNRQIEQATGTLGGIREDFYSAAGPSRAGFDVKPTLGGAIHEGTPEQMDAGRALINAAYGGPQGFNQEKSQELLGQFEPLFGYREAFTRGGPGREALISQSYPGLTMGEARFESQSLGQSLGFRQQADETAARIQRLFGVAAAEERNARDFAQARTAEEADIANRSREYVTGERGAIVTGLEADVAAREEEQRRAQEGWDYFLQNPSRENLVALANAYPGLIDWNTAARFISPSYAQEARAKDAYREIIEAHPNLKDIDPLELGISRHGREKLAIPKETKADIKGLAGELGIKGKKLKMELRERQKELEAAGFSPRTTRTSTQAVTSKEDPLGQFAPYKPLYFGEPFEAPNLLGYLGFDKGQKPTIQNLATDEQIGVYNRIEDLLGEVDRWEKAGEPYRGARVLAEVDSFLTDEEAKLDQQKESLTDNAKHWRKLVRRARARYKDYDRKVRTGRIVMSLFPPGVIGFGAFNKRQQGSIGAVAQQVMPGAA